MKMAKVVLSFLMVAMVTRRDVIASIDPAFCGGYMSFYFTNTSNPELYTVHVTVITGWVLGHGPCGPGCDVSRVGTSTHQSRLDVYSNTANPDALGSWLAVTRSWDPFYPGLTETYLFNYMRNHIQGRVSAVSRTLQWEQEIADFELQINTTFPDTELRLQGVGSGKSWKHFDVNNDDVHFSINGNSSDYRSFMLKTKIIPQIRNDTGKPNSSPLALYKQVYKILLNHVTDIRITTSDKEEDLVSCREAKNVELDGIGSLPNLVVSKDCVITIDTNSANGNFHDDGFGVVGVAVEDYNQHTIQTEKDVFEAYSRPLSTSVLNFMIWVVANMTIPDFVEPTPESQHVYQVFAGSLLRIPLAAKPHNLSEPTTRVVKFQVLSLPDHALTAEVPIADQTRLHERVVTSVLEWRSSDTDVGNFIIQVVAVDSEESESMDRSYRIHVNEFHQIQGYKTDANPYFPFFPEPGSVTCPEKATCSIPIFAKAGTDGHVISSIEIVGPRTDLSPVEIASQVELVHSYRGSSELYRADLHFTAMGPGHKSVCFRATDDHGLSTERCVSVLLYPPDPCSTMECQNGAICVSTPDKLNFTCTCPPYKTGRLCEKDADLCDHNDCGPGGGCTVRRIAGVQRYLCQCNQEPGYTMNAADGFHSCVEKDECKSNPCQHGGTCVDKLNNFECFCDAGFIGKRCETADPCGSHPCASQTHTVCDPHPGSSPAFTCPCVIPYTGTACNTMDTCSSGRCENQAVCKPGTESDPSAPGFHCQCQPGYNGLGCQHETIKCASERCEPGSICIMEGSTAVCKCRVDKAGNKCRDSVKTPLVETVANQPHLLVPSLGPGSTIKCNVGETCPVPIYMTAPTPYVVTGPTSPEVIANVTPPTAAVTPPGTSVSTLTVSPTAAGHHHVCVEVHANAGSTSAATDHVCYNIDSQILGPPTPTPTSGGTFTGSTPPNGSELRCRIGTPCHVFVQTPKNGTSCEDIQTQTVGVYTFNSTETPNGVCTTDVLIDPTNINANPTQACVQVGFAGEKRCYPVTTIDPNVTVPHDPKNDPCDPNPCHNGGLCVPDSSQKSDHFTCACPVPFSGHLCDAISDPCFGARNPCQPGGTCHSVQQQSDYYFFCHCSAGYVASMSHQTCVEVNECDSHPCLHGGVCVDLINAFQCLCPIGFKGQKCQTAERNNCDPNPCHANGQCVHLGDAFHCLCDGSYTGDTCEHAVPLVTEWSEGGLQEDEWLSVCAGSQVNFNWKVNSSGQRDVLDSAQWHFVGRSQEMVALLENGHFVVLPAFSGRVYHLGDAAIQLTGLAILDSGVYSVEVVVGDLMAGRIGTLHGSVHLRVLGDSECHACSSNPCRNGGVCVNMANGFQCRCATGYTDFTCETVLGLTAH